MNNAVEQKLSMSGLYITVEGHEKIKLPCRMRNHYAPLKLSNANDKVSVTVQKNDEHHSVVIHDVQNLEVPEHWTLTLKVGANRFKGQIIAADGVTSAAFDFTIIRGQAQPQWEKILEHAPWAARDSAGELVFKNRMWLLGGYTPSLANDVWSSSDGKAWTREGDVPTDAGIDIPVTFEMNGQLFVMDFSGVLFKTNDGKKWDIASRDVPWRGRLRAGCAVFNGRVWVMGGSSADQQLLNDIWSSEDGINWIQHVEYASWCGRQIDHTPLVHDGKIWLLGGSAMGTIYHPFVAWNDVWCSSDGIDWQCVRRHAPWRRRIWGSTAVYRGRLWLIGGFQSEPAWKNLGDVWYSSDGEQWHQFESWHDIEHAGVGEVPFVQTHSHWEARHEQSVYVHDEALWLVGGMVWPLMNDVWRLQINGFQFVTQPELEMYQNGLYEYAARADFHQNDQQVQYKLITAPDWLNIDAETGHVTGVCSTTGTFLVVIQAAAGQEMITQSYEVDVLPLS